MTGVALARLRVAQLRPDAAQALIADIGRHFEPSDAVRRRLLWDARTLAAQMQCARPANIVQGRRALLQIRNEVLAEQPVSTTLAAATPATARMMDLLGDFIVLPFLICLEVTESV